MNHRLRLALWFLLIGLIVWATVLQVQVSSFDFSCSRQPGGCLYTVKPLLSVELSLSGKAFCSVLTLGDLETNISVIRLNTWLDFIFIGLYWTLLYLFARYHKNRWSPWVVTLISIAAGCDLLENWRILVCLSHLARGEVVSNFTPGYFSYPKWIATGLGIIALGLLIKAAGVQAQSGEETVAPRSEQKSQAQPANSTPAKKKSVLVLSGCLVGLGALIPVMTFMNRPMPAPPGVLFMAISVLLVIVFLILPFVLALILYYPFPIEATLTVIEYAYLIRFPIIFASLLAVVLPAFYWLVPSIFVGIFDAVSWWSMAMVVWAAFQLAWVVMVTSRLILVYGGERFPGVKPAPIKSVGARTVVLFGLLAVPFVFALFLGTLDPNAWQKAGAIFLGLIAAIAGLYLTARFHFKIEPSGNTANKAFPSFGRLQHTKDERPSAAWDFVAKQLAKLPNRLQRGLTEGGHLRSGHQLAAIALGGLLLCYIALGFLYLPHLVRPEWQPAAVLYLLLLFAILTWLLAGVSFFLDVVRLPVLTTLLALSFLTGLTGTDHQFEIPRHPEMASLPPDAITGAWAKTYRENYKRDPQTAIIVATAGGGIRAAAWTAEVLTGLQQKCGTGFSSSLLLVSSVSGGSVGTMSVLNGYSGNRNFPEEPDALKRIRFNASRSSLSAVGWGLVFPDFARTFPFFGSMVPDTIDRGWSLETSWVSGWKKPPNMSDWRDEVALGKRPAVIFNATGSESGKRFIIASADLDSNNAVRFFRDFAGFDVPVSTAARLSASFPYVSPETRPSNGPDPIRVHVGDGGYYDNSGILSALEWLDDARTALKPYTVLLILIDAGPDKPKKMAPWSWQRQLTAPLETLLNVRTSSQDDRDNLELHLEENVVGSVLTSDHVVRFLYPIARVKNKEAMNRQQNTDYCFGAIAKAEEENKRQPRALWLQPDESSPLSWHLNKLQKQAIVNACNTPGNLQASDEVCKVLPQDLELVPTIH